MTWLTSSSTWRTLISNKEKMIVVSVNGKTAAIAKHWHLSIVNTAPHGVIPMTLINKVCKYTGSSIIWQQQAIREIEIFYIPFLTWGWLRSSYYEVWWIGVTIQSYLVSQWPPVTVVCPEPYDGPRVMSSLYLACDSERAIRHSEKRWPSPPSINRSTGA